MDIGREVRVIEVVEEEEIHIDFPAPAVPASFESRRPAPLPEDES